MEADETVRFVCVSLPLCYSCPCIAFLSFRRGAKHLEITRSLKSAGIGIALPGKARFGSRPKLESSLTVTIVTKAL